jgi:hypothetical protein
MKLLGLVVILIGILGLAIGIVAIISNAVNVGLGGKDDGLGYNLITLSAFVLFVIGLIILVLA